jgi:KUP system potassium uptake protein
VINRAVSIITKAKPQEEIPAADDHSLVVDITPCQNFFLFFNLSLRSLGIIFGDIGTSPLYVVNTIFTSQPSESQCIGAISLVVWSLIVSVTIKYGTFILMADNHGEGGTFALCGLLTSETSPLGVKTKRTITILAIAAASLLLGDGALTPAVSVLSSVEGIAVEAPNLQKWILPISIIIIVLLFLAQRWGTSKIGIVFGPIMFLWFLSLFIIGIWRTTIEPRILKAFDPWEAFHYLLIEKKTGFYQIGSVFLSVTGLEALYADLGHFGRWPIRCAWFFVVFPAVLFNYLGQGALLIADPTLVDNPFYHAVPHWAHWPMVVLATVATIIASQAIITGSFSLISQAIGMQCSAPFKIFHTSKKVIGQIYVPTIDYILMVLTIIVAVGFGTGNSITNAYGVTVCSVMIITTVLYMFVMHYIWRKPWYLILAFSIFLITDGYTWASNLMKIPTGGWVAIVIAVGFFIFGFSWFFGQLSLNRFLKSHSPTTSLHTLSIRLGLANNTTRHNSVNSLEDLPLISTANRIEFEEDSDSDSDSDTVFEEKRTKKLNKVQGQVHLVKNVPAASSLHIPIECGSSNQAMNNTIPAVITPGVGCFLTRSTKHTPHVFENFLFHMHSVPQLIIFLQIEHKKMSKMKNSERLKIKQYGENIFHISAFYGYSEYRIQPHEILALARAEYNIPVPADTTRVTIFVPNESIKVSTTGWRTWFRRWPLYLYSILKSIYPGAEVNIKLEAESTINIGIVAKLD